MHRPIKLLSMAAVLCAVLWALAYAHPFTPHRLNYRLTPSQIEADGSSTATLEIRGPHLERLTVASADEARLRVESATLDGNILRLKLRAGVLPGAARLRVAGSTAARDFTLALASSLTDSYGDGTPDFLRLDDSDLCRGEFVSGTSPKIGEASGQEA